MALERMLKTDDFFVDTLPNGFCPILFATQNDLTDIGILLANGHTDLNVWDSDQEWTPLMHSISNKNELLTVQLIDRNCDLNLVNGDGNTALHIATDIENDVIVKQLLMAQADRNILNDDDMTPLDIARANGDEIIAALLQKN
jgi:ankyrin repeat protein